MKRVIVLILLIGLLLLPGVLAVKEAKVSGWYASTDSFTFNKATYTLRLMSGEYRADDEEHNLYGGTLRIRKNDESFIVSVGSCYEDINRTYCFVNKSFDRKEVDIDSQGNLQPAIQISLIEYTYEATLDIKRSFEKTKFALYEEGEVTITVTNTGDKMLSNIRITETTPDGFNITRAQQNTVQVGNSILGTFHLLPGKSWTTTYKIKGIDYKKSSYTTSALYDTEQETDFEKKSSSATLEVLSPYKVTSSLAKKVDRNTPTEYKITITNNENEELQINNLKVYVPLSVGISSRTNLNTYSFNVLSHKGTIEPKTTKEFLVRLQTPYVGNYVLSYEGDITLKGKDYNISGESPLEVYTKGMNCYFTFNKPTLEAGRSLQYTVVLKNLGETDDYLNINGTIHTPYEDINFFIPSMIRGDSETVVNNRYTLPFNTEDVKYPFRIEAKYYTSAGQEFTCVEENDYLVKGAETILLYDVFVSADKPSPGKQVNVVISTTNEIVDTINNITIYSNTTDPVRITSETRREIATLEQYEKIEVYTIEIEIPANYTKETIEIITTGIVNSHDYIDSITTIIPVKHTLETEEEDVEEKKETTKDIDEKETTSPTTQPEKKEGFFARVWTIIKRLW